MRLIAAFVVGGLLGSGMCIAQVAVRTQQGSMHGFTVVRSGVDGKLLGTGDYIQTANGRRVTAKLILRFNDGSVDEETSVFQQQGELRLVSDHHVQKGPFFKNPIDVRLNVPNQTVSTKDKDGDEKTKHKDLGDDLANGILPALLVNVAPWVSQTKVSYVATSPKPMKVGLEISPEGEDEFTVGGYKRKANKYVMHVKLNFIENVGAKLLGKEPMDFHIWVSAGEAPTFLRLDGQLAVGGQAVRMEMAAPVWK